MNLRSDLSCSPHSQFSILFIAPCYILLAGLGGEEGMIQINEGHTTVILQKALVEPRPESTEASRCHPLSGITLLPGEGALVTATPSSSCCFTGFLQLPALFPSLMFFLT